VTLQLFSTNLIVPPVTALLTSKLWSFKFSTVFSSSIIPLEKLRFEFPGSEYWLLSSLYGATKYETFSTALEHSLTIG